MFIRISNNNKKKENIEHSTNSDHFCLLLDPWNYNLINVKNKDYLINCFNNHLGIQCKSMKLLDILDSKSLLYPIFHVELRDLEKNTTIIDYNFENLKKDNYQMNESSLSFNHLEIIFFRIEYMNTLKFQSEAYNLEFNNNIFWIFVAVVLFGILNLGFILLFLGKLINMKRIFYQDLEMIFKI